MKFRVSGYWANINIENFCYLLANQCISAYSRCGLSKAYNSNAFVTTFSARDEFSPMIEP